MVGIVAVVVLLIAAPFFQARTPEAYTRARNLSIEMEPTATAAALVNEAKAAHDAIVVPAQATAEAASILANNAQRIDEDAHQQALRHKGEMAALTISNTKRLNEVDAAYIARIEGIKANGAKVVSEAQADAARASAGAWRDTITYGGIALGAVVALVGVSLAIVTALSTRAKIINHPVTGPMLVTGRGVIMLGNVTTPVIAWSAKQPILLAGDNERGLVAQRQAFALIHSASKSNNADVVRAADRAANTALQQNWSGNAVLSSAVQALPAGNRDELSGKAPAFEQLMQSWRPTREQMLLAFDQGGQPIYVALNDMLSGVIIGRQKQGKTTFMRFVYAQCALIGVDVRVWDLHEDVVDDLPGASAYTTAEGIRRSVIELTAELERRIKMRLKHGRAQPIMVLADEVNQLVGVVPECVGVFERIIAEGRKYDIYCDVSAKGVPADLLGQSWVRDSLSTRVAFLTTPHQARLIGIDKDAARMVAELTPGHAVLDGPVQPQIVTFPNVTADNVRSLLPGKAPSRATFRAPSEPLPEYAAAPSAEAAEAGESGRSYGPEVAENVVRLWKEGKTNTSQPLYSLRRSSSVTKPTRWIRSATSDSLAAFRIRFENHVSLPASTR